MLRRSLSWDKIVQTALHAKESEMFFFLNSKNDSKTGNWGALQSLSHDFHLQVLYFIFSQRSPFLLLLTNRCCILLFSDRTTGLPQSWFWLVAQTQWNRIKAYWRGIQKGQIFFNTVCVKWFIFRVVNISTYIFCAYFPRKIGQIWITSEATTPKELRVANYGGKLLSVCASTFVGIDRANKSSPRPPKNNAKRKAGEIVNRLPQAFFATSILFPSVPSGLSGQLSPVFRIPRSIQAFATQVTRFEAWNGALTIIFFSHHIHKNKFVKRNGLFHTKPENARNFTFAQSPGPWEISFTWMQVRMLLRERRKLHLHYFAERKKEKTSISFMRRNFALSSETSFCLSFLLRTQENNLRNCKASTVFMFSDLIRICEYFLTRSVEGIRACQYAKFNAIWNRKEQLLFPRS